MVPVVASPLQPVNPRKRRAKNIFALNFIFSPQIALTVARLMVTDITMVL